MILINKYNNRRRQRRPCPRDSLALVALSVLSCTHTTRVNARRRASTRVQNAEIESGSNSASYCVGFDAV